MQNNLRQSLNNTIRALCSTYKELPSLMALKALQDYDNSLTRLVSIFLEQMRHDQLADASGFGVDFANAIEAGLNEAWRLGMRENTDEMLEEWQAELDGIIAEERSHIPDFAGYLAEVAVTAESIGAAINTARARLDLWVNRYEEVRTRAILASAEEKTKMMWNMGPTEKHCQDCFELNGIVAYAREWEEYGLQPQSRTLACGGWHCQCTLSPTDERVTPKGQRLDLFDRIRKAQISR